jgi:hypothetical protein
MVDKYKMENSIMSIFDDRRIELAQLNAQNEEQCKIYMDKLKAGMDLATSMIKTHLDLILEERRVETEKEARAYLRFVSDKCNLDLDDVEDIYNNYRSELKGQMRQYNSEVRSALEATIKN